MSTSNEPVFARPHSADTNGIPREAQAGMVKREVFILAAMHAQIIARSLLGQAPEQHIDEIADAAERIADAQLARI